MNNARIERLRDRLLGQGSPTIAPPPPSPGSAAPRNPPASNRPEDQAIYDRLRPFAEAVYLVVSADRQVSERERDALRGALRILTEGALSSAAMDAMIDEFDRAFARDGYEQRLDTVAAELYGDVADHELALALAAAAAAADGQLDAAERATLDALADRLGVSPEQLADAAGLALPIHSPAPALARCGPCRSRSRGRCGGGASRGRVRRCAARARR